MQPVEFVIDRNGEITEHPADFDAVGRNLAEFVNARTWPWVAHAMGTAIVTGMPQQTLCELRAGFDVAAVLLDFTFHRATDSFRVVARSAIQVPAELALDMMFRVALFDPSHRWPTTIEYETENAKQAAKWVRQWLKDHRGKTVAVVPPRA